LPLNHLSIRNISAASKVTRYYDERGLYLEVSPRGGKWWRLKYRFQGKEKRLALGVYPDVSLKEARERRDASRRLLSEGTDPSHRRKELKIAQTGQARNSFELVTQEWLEKHSASWAESHRSRVARLFERDVYHLIGSRPISQIAAPELLSVLRRIEGRGAVDTAHRALGFCGQVFRYAIATGRCERDPSGDLRGALGRAHVSHFAATTEPKQFAAILKSMDGYDGGITVRCALRLAPRVFVRPGELRRALWKDIDFEVGEWRYTVTKTKVPHIVPLSKQALQILKDIHPTTGNGKFVFPSARSNDRPMSDNAVLAAMRRMEIEKSEMTGHGLRAVARTILDEVLGFRPDVIEHQLAHAVRDPNGRAYNRTAHLEERRRMMQEWSDYLDGLKNQLQ
jgi:integrase